MSGKEKTILSFVSVAIILAIMIFSELIKYGIDNGMSILEFLFFSIYRIDLASYIRNTFQSFTIWNYASFSLIGLIWLYDKKDDSKKPDTRGMMREITECPPPSTGTKDYHDYIKDRRNSVKPIQKEESGGCTIACIAMLLNVPYWQARDMIEKEGFTIRENGGFPVNQKPRLILFLEKYGWNYTIEGAEIYLVTSQLKGHNDFYHASLVRRLGMAEEELEPDTGEARAWKPEKDNIMQMWGLKAGYVAPQMAIAYKPPAEKFKKPPADLARQVIREDARRLRKNKKGEY